MRHPTLREVCKFITVRVWSYLCVAFAIIWRNRIVIIIAAIALFAAYFAWRDAQMKTPREPIPQSMPSAQVYRLYLPLFVAPEPNYKKGIGLTYGHCEDVWNVHATWQYGWMTHPQDCPNVENIPMIWGAQSIEQPLGGNSNWIMGFNEPDLSGQSNITPTLAATLWHEIEAKYPDRKLVSPAPSQLNREWIRDFRIAYIAQYGTPPRLDALAFHWYGWWADDAIYLAEYYKALAREWNVPEIWLTEFAMPTQPAPDECWEGAYAIAQPEAQKLLVYLEQDEMVTRYAWFAARIQGTEWWSDSRCFAALIDYDTGTCTTWGALYAGMIP